MSSVLVCVCRNELQRELALRRELEEEGERARDEREERARVIARELGEAMRQRDQAAHTAHSLETALKCSQVSHMDTATALVMTVCHDPSIIERGPLYPKYGLRSPLPCPCCGLVPQRSVSTT